ncbi:MAG TPA: GEVED domain-containing protein [Chitinophagaceae bacterium]|nr:GEVED domain-containing protein [Chitinophagaceae bacterium]
MGVSKAQTPISITIGNSAGPGSWFYGPIMRSSSNANTLNYSRHAYIYTAAELGIPSGARIIKLEWLKKDGGTIVVPNTFNVFLTNTNATSFPTTAQWSTLVNGATQTYANSSFPVTIGNNAYLSAPFNIPGSDSFTYSGSNLQILTDWFKGGLQTGNGINFYSYSTGSAGKAIGIASASPITGSLPALQTATYGNQRPTIRITYVPVPPCSGVPSTGMAISSASSVCANVPFTLSIQNTIAGGGVSFVWQRADDLAFTTNVANVGASATLTTSITSSKYYRCIASCSGSGLSDTSNPVFVPMSQHYECYCNTSTAISAADEEIFNFKFGSLDNSSNCTTTAPGPGSSAQLYSNYQGLTPPNVEKLSEVPFSIEVGTCLNFYPNRSGIFIDYNQNGVYEASEQVYSTPAPISGPHVESGILTIPSTALTGLTGLRVITIEQSAPVNDPCVSYSWGETEDYLINITPTTICSGPPTPGNTISNLTSICPGKNVVLSVQFLTIGQGVSYQWYDGNGPIAGATASTYNSYAFSTPTTFYCAVTCNTTSSVTNSTPVNIGINGFVDCYCPSEAGNDADEDIFSFTFNGNIYATDCNTAA